MKGIDFIDSPIMEKASVEKYMHDDMAARFHLTHLRNFSLFRCAYRKGRDHKHA
jgi:hypothetical protein